MSWSYGRVLWALAIGIGPALCNMQMCAASEYAIPLSATVVDGEQLGAKPGDTILLEAGLRSSLKIQNVVGDEKAYITIRNREGEVLIRNTDQRFDIFVAKSRYVHLTGLTLGGERYGIHLAGTRLHGSCLIVADLSSDCEIDHLQVDHAGFAGMLVKTDGAVGTVMDHVMIHDNYIHDTGGEGLYVGETKIPGQLFHHLKIWNNIIARTGYEACQICNIVDDCEISNNVFYHAGLRGDLWQDRSIQISHSVCEFVGNLVIQAHHSLLISDAGGAKHFENNYFEGCVTGPGVEVRDNEMATYPESFVAFSKNFLRGIPAVQPVILYIGEKTPFRVAENTWEDEGQFLRMQPIIDLSKVVTSERNTHGTVPRPRFVDEAHDDFRLADGDFYKARGIGLLSR